MKLKIQLQRRKIDKKVEFPTDLHPLLHRIYASRGIRSTDELERSIKKILPWKELSGIERSVRMLYEAFRRKMRIVIVGDFDTDGATSTALSFLSIKSFGYNNITYLVPNRFKDGYGLSSKIVSQAYSYCGAQMIMTVDNGISSHAGVDYANRLGIPVLITDHHLPGNTLPNAKSIINPNLRDCNFSSKFLSGVGVAFYLMLALRAFLRDQGWFEENNITIPNITDYLDLVALGTIADLVPLDFNNRILIWQGLNRIKMGKCRPGIKALLEISSKDTKKIASNDLGFALGPRLNAAGRLNDMSIGVALLLCENINEARILAHELDVLNKTRKEIELEMYSKALSFFKTIKNEEINLPSGIVMYHPDWHQGIVGILASRIKDRFHRPVIAFAPAEKDILKGSGRSICGLHILNALEYLNKKYPDLIIKFGGHSMAVGLSIEKSRFEDFKYLFRKLLKEWINPAFLSKKVISDGPLTPKEMTIEVAQILRDAGPWGQMFPEPVFDGCFKLLRQRLISKKHLKVTVEPINGGPLLEGIIFNVDTTYWPNNIARVVELTYKLDINEFRGNRNLQIIIDNIWLVQPTY